MFRFSARSLLPCPARLFSGSTQSLWAVSENPVQGWNAGTSTAYACVVLNVHNCTYSTAYAGKVPMLRMLQVS